MTIHLLILGLLLSLSLHAETEQTKEKKEIPTKEDKGKIINAAKNVSGETKRLLRKVGRKSMDATCELSESKALCDKQKAEHAALIKKEEVEGVEGN